MAVKLTEPEILEKLNAAPAWLRDGDEIQRKLRFPDFKAAMAFVNRVADLAEGMDHHPDILVQYNRVTLSLAPHSAGGLTVMDFELAKRIDASAGLGGAQ